MKNISGNAPELVRLIPDQTGYTRQEWYGFSNPEAIASLVETTPDRAYWEKTCLSDDPLFGNCTMPGAIALCRDGWKEGAERVDAMRDRIKAANPVGPRIVRYDVAGAYPVVPRALAGNPLNMRRIDSARLRRRPVLNLIINIGGLSHVPADCFVNRAAVVAAVLDEMESAGFSVSVTALSQSKTDGFLCGVVTSLKDAGAQVDVARLAFGAGHVGMFRRLVFAIRSSNAANRPLGDGLGQTVEIKTTDADTFVLPSLNETYEMFRTEKDAATAGLAWAVKTLASQGCPAFPAQEANAA